MQTARRKRGPPSRVPGHGRSRRRRRDSRQCSRKADARVTGPGRVARKVEPQPRADGLAGVRVHLPRDDVACVAQLTRRLAVTRAGDAVGVQADLPEGECTLVVANADGEVLVAQAAQAGANTIELSALPEDARPACVKLLRDGQLVDIAALPEA